MSIIEDTFAKFNIENDNYKSAILEMEANSRQKSYTGKNLVNVFVTPTAISGTSLPTYSISEDGYISYDNSLGRYASMMFNTFEVSPSTKYYSYADIITTSGSPTIYIQELDENNANLGAIYPKNAVFTTKSNTKYLRYGLTTDGLHTAAVYKIRPMIVKSTIADNIYEPYVRTESQAQVEIIHSQYLMFLGIFL